MTFASTDPPHPVVAIVGRPNVGKSSLFNRLAGRRIAITDEQPGVTRDPVESDCDVLGHPIRLVDTGGVTTEPGIINELVTRRSLERAESAALVLLMLEVGEVTGEDEEFIERMRAQRDKIILVVNKVDNPDRQQSVWDFYQYGFQSVVGVSAAHGIGMTDLEEAIIEHLPAVEGPSEPNTGDAGSASDGDALGRAIRVAILGQPNTGKSTLLNTLVGSDRAIVSEIAGTTRDTIEGRFSHRGIDYVVVDTAGIRRRTKINDDVEYYSVNRAIGAVEDCDVALLLVDAEKGLSDQDKKIAARIVDRGRGVLLIINKWDQFEKIPNMRQAFIDRTRFVFPVLSFAPVLTISAQNGTGIPKLLSTIHRAYRQLHTRVETGPLNRALEAWVEHSPPPAPKGKPFKARYLTQVGTLPVRFVLFVNRTKGFPASYVQYVTNRIREEFGFDSVPVKVELRGKRA